jgi:predicted CopG family antitoxin
MQEEVSARKDKTYLYMHMRIHIGIIMVKVISVSDEVYTMLVKVKGQKLSFSEVIKASLSKNRGNKNDIMDLFGSLKGEIDAKKWKAELYADRKRSWSD